MAGPKLLTAEDIRRALLCLSDQLAAGGQCGELVIVGGAAISLTLGGRDATRDVDGYISKPEAAVMRVAAQRVAELLDLPPDWLNDGAKGYMLRVDLGQLVFQSAALTVYAASNTQLLAMKLWAWRDDQDYDDAEKVLRALLLEAPELKQSEVWERVEQFLPDSERLKPSYALQDLWERCFDVQPQV